MAKDLKDAAAEAVAKEATELGEALKEAAAAPDLDARLKELELEVADLAAFAHKCLGYKPKA